MKVLTYTDQEIADILRVLAALLHLGNLRHQGNLSPLLSAVWSGRGGTRSCWGGWWGVRWRPTGFKRCSRWLDPPSWTVFIPKFALIFYITWLWSNSQFCLNYFEMIVWIYRKLLWLYRKVSLPATLTDACRGMHPLIFPLDLLLLLAGEQHTWYTMRDFLLADSPWHHSNSLLLVWQSVSIKEYVFWQ